MKELLTNYGPVCLIWFDTPRMMDVGDRGQRFIDIVHNWQPATLIDGRLGERRGLSFDGRQLGFPTRW